MLIPLYFVGTPVAALQNFAVLFQTKQLVQFMLLAGKSVLIK